MKKCIWCFRSSPTVSFEKRAHTFPQSMGGVHICDNVCDDCNHKFGLSGFKKPSVETVLKEVLNLSGYVLLLQTGKALKNKRFKSIYFKLNIEKMSIKLKPAYSIQKGFQENMGRQLRRGLYKVFLEERERQIGDAHNQRFDFIRRFARYNLEDYPVYYTIPKFNAVFMSLPDVINPTIRFTEFSAEEEKKYGIFRYEILGHTFCIPTSPLFEGFGLENYLRKLNETNDPMGVNLIPIRYATDIDFTFSRLSSKKI